MVQKFKSKLAHLSSKINQHPLSVMGNQALELSFVSDEDLKEFDLYDDPQERKGGILVTSLEDLGFPDPFPVSLNLETLFAPKGKKNQKLLASFSE